MTATTPTTAPTQGKTHKTWASDNHHRTLNWLTGSDGGVADYTHIRR